MRFKKGFTLAEILIVLMVIGVIATMTIPSLMKGVTEAQYKTGYKKAYNTIVNFAAMERISGQLPARATDNAAQKLLQALNNSLSVKSYADQTVNAGTVLGSAGYYNAMNITIDNQTSPLGGASGNTGTTNAIAAKTITSSVNSAWLVTEDNLAYTVLLGTATANCLTKQQIAAASSEANAIAGSCAIIVVDVNGLSKGPNTYEMQGISDTGGIALTSTSTLDTLTGDQYKIYLGIDGATAGPKDFTATGRIVADIK